MWQLQICHGSRICPILCNVEDGDNGRLIQDQEICDWYRNQMSLKHIWEKKVLVFHLNEDKKGFLQNIFHN